MNLLSSILLSASGLTAQSERLKVISENLANADSTSQTPGGDPYRRKMVSFQDTLDHQLGGDKVSLGPVAYDQTPFELKYDPQNPGANAQGYVKMPNVNTMIEMADMREAENSYQANLSAIDAAKNMLMQTVGLLST